MYFAIQCACSVQMLSKSWLNYTNRHVSSIIICALCIQSCPLSSFHKVVYGSSAHWTSQMHMYTHLYVYGPSQASWDTKGQSGVIIFHIVKHQKVKEEPANHFHQLLVVHLFILIHWTLHIWGEDGGMRRSRKGRRGWFIYFCRLDSIIVINWHCISSNRHHPQIVAAQSEALTEINATLK